MPIFFFFSSRRRHTRCSRDWSSDVCSSDLNYSHDLIFDTGRYVLHLLRDDQFELIHRLGFTSGRARDKLVGVPHRTGTLGVPVLDDCYAHLECRVANVMDTGSSTCFLGDVVAVGHGAADRPSGIVMTAAHFRANMPAEWRGGGQTAAPAARAPTAVARRGTWAARRERVASLR